VGEKDPQKHKVSGGRRSPRAFYFSNHAVFLMSLCGGARGRTAAEGSGGPHQCPSVAALQLLPEFTSGSSWAAGEGFVFTNIR